MLCTNPWRIGSPKCQWFVVAIIVVEINDIKRNATHPMLSFGVQPYDPLEQSCIPIHSIP